MNVIPMKKVTHFFIEMYGPTHSKEFPNVEISLGGEKGKRLIFWICTCLEQESDQTPSPVTPSNAYFRGLLEPAVPINGPADVAVSPSVVAIH